MYLCCNTTHRIIIGISANGRSPDGRSDVLAQSFLHCFQTLSRISFRLCGATYLLLCLVPVEGIEPPLLAEHDFESCASTSSATRACAAIYIRRLARRAKRKSSGPRRAPIGTRRKA